jgi:hypothetical protein
LPGVLSIKATTRGSLDEAEEAPIYLRTDPAPRICGARQISRQGVLLDRRTR